MSENAIDRVNLPPIAQRSTEKILSWMENGTAPFLPNKDGIIDTHGIRSGSSGRLFKGMNQILAKGYLNEMGKDDDKIVTFKQAKDAQTFVKKGEKGFSLSVYDAEKNQSNVYYYFPLSATANPEKIIPSLNPKAPHSFYQNDVKTVECNDSNPEKYLGKYLMAVTIGAEFKASPEVIEQFKKEYTQEIKQGISDKKYTRIFELGNKASASCKEELAQMYAATRDGKERQQNQGKEKPTQQRNSQEITPDR